METSYTNNEETRAEVEYMYAIKVDKVYVIKGYLYRGMHFMHLAKSR